MNTTSAAEELAKINHYFAVVQKHPEGARRLDLDTLLEHTRRFYDALQSVPLSKGGISITLNEHEAAPEPVVPPVAVLEKPEPRPAETVVHRPEAKPAPKPAEPVAPKPLPAIDPVATQPIPSKPEPVVPVRPVAPPMPATSIDQRTVNDPAPTVKDSRPVTVRTPVSAALDPEFEELFAIEPVADLGGRLAQTSIPDLRRAISINDKLQYIGSLFQDDSRAFDSAIDALNQLSDLISAKQYIQANLLLPYAWMEEEKRTVLRSFVRLLHRRYKNS
jgi:hypothetical protein